jgi:alkylation response protein AidB-like acyl-CoA dehydrogenase
MSWPGGGRVADNPFFRTFICWFAPTIAAVYTGIGVGARNLVREAMAKKSRLPYGEVRHYPGVQYSIAEMYIDVEAARAMTRRTAARLSDPAWRDIEAMALAEATQEFATSAAVRVVDKAMELSGGGAYFKRTPLERMYRDVRAGKFHPLPHYDALEIIGKAELGVPDDQSPRFL